MEINNASMDSLLDWRQVFITVFPFDISEFSKIMILEFSDSTTEILVVFCPEKQSVGQHEPTIF